MSLPVVALDGAVRLCHLGFYFSAYNPRIEQREFIAEKSLGHPAKHKLIRPFPDY
jgi:hypothetical protein